MMTTAHEVITIGHSTHRLAAFVALLKDHRVDVLVDVRSAPDSRFTPHFNRESLAEELKAHGVRYLYLGRELGARSEDPSCYENGRVQFARLASTGPFKEGIARVIRGAEKYRVALMCAEKEPLECHRTLLIGRALEGRGVVVQHILADGRLEEHHDTLMRLLERKDTSSQSQLFPELEKSVSERLEEALARQEERIAYVDEKVAEEARGEAP